ncbi:MAG: radical SAM protein [Rhodocyclales bacterium GT-UBC]|nr:MAG: radical SAM protein [Rhodocyclales bacterium GT-UBC]
MNIILIRPNMGDYRSADAMPPLAMGILAARASRHQVRFFDDKAEAIPPGLEADLVALSVETFTARRAYQIADDFRRRGIPVVMGGYHPTFLPEEALQHADTIVTGDAEGAWERLLEDAAKGRLQRIYRGDNQARLDDIRIDRSIFAGKRYAPVELAQYGRGCRFVCDFCSIHQFYGPRTRTRPAEQLRDELAGLNSKRLLFFVDDNLFSSRPELDALLRVMTPLRRHWSCQISIDVARDSALLDRLAAAGCRYVLIGFESLEPANLKQMRKPWNQVAGEYRRVVAALHARGIGIYGTFVFGYDHDTPDTIRRSLDFALESRLDIANFNPLTPTPGSALYDRLRDEGRLLSPQWWLDPDYRYGDPIFQPRQISAGELAEGCFEAKRAFYAWSSIVRRVFDNDTPFSWFSRSMTTVANLISRREVYRKQGRSLGT